MKKIRNYINGQLREPSGQNYLEVYRPATGQHYAWAPDSDHQDIERAVHAAQQAFPAWAATTLEERHDILMSISNLILEKLDELALAESIDNGKPLWLARKVDIRRSSSNFRFFATAIMQYASEAHEMNGLAINYTLRKPLGVVGCISPWNLPLYLFSWKIAPALAAGNTVVAKPSEVTPMTAFLLSEICIEAGLPAGVLNIVHGLGHKTGPAISSHRAVKAISFTGSTRVGKEIATTAAPLFKRLSLEMGGKNPTLIFADCHYEKMLDMTVRSSYTNQGQICLCGSRIYVEKTIYEKFKKDFVEKTRQLKVGDPLDKNTNIGAVVSKAHHEKILYYIDLAQKEGGRILCGGQSIKPKGLEKGWYIQPTVIEGLDPDCRTNQEEIFGPVVTITPFENDEEALQLANQSNYGLSATIWTENLSRAHRLADQLEAGIIWINTWMLRDLRTPFGGMKDSGVGREGGMEALRFFTEPKNVCIEY